MGLGSGSWSKKAPDPGSATHKILYQLQQQKIYNIRSFAIFSKSSQDRITKACSVNFAPPLVTITVSVIILFKSPTHLTVVKILLDVLDNDPLWMEFIIHPLDEDPETTANNWSWWYKFWFPSTITVNCEYGSAFICKNSEWSLCSVYRCTRNLWFETQQIITVSCGYGSAFIYTNSPRTVPVCSYRAHLKIPV